MFKKITLRNYRTHRDTTLELQPITLLIGNNSSGKSNFLSGIQHFSLLIRRGNPIKEEDPIVEARDYFPHRYRLANDDESMSIEIEWSKNNHFVKYYMELYKYVNFAENVACREKIELISNQSEVQRFENGYQAETNLLELQSQIRTAENIKEKELLNDFFRDFAYTFSYHLQPSFLKGIVEDPKKRKFDNDENSDENRIKIRMNSDLGYEGGNLQNLIKHVKNNEERVFSRFLTLMRRFASKNFQGIRYDDKKSQLLWEFDLGRTTTDRLVDEFSPNVISDGLIKAAAIALLVSIQRPPALILIEEIENGINPGNIQELIYWLWQATAPNQQDFTPQFILTSHSPSVLREFHQDLHSVYTFRLNKRNESDVRSLSKALDILVGIGTIEEGEIIEDEKTGERQVQIPKYKLAELWYDGIIG
ncbi:MAG: ATP-binding protein [Hormoscilla sp. GM7CHS1pb]|nr:ATP-binding protein [Hormoscilla sp. GM7CHS1pb]